MLVSFLFFFFKQKTAYEITEGDWSSDVCSSDLRDRVQEGRLVALCKRALERVDLEAVVVHRQTDDVGTEPRQDLQRAVVRRRLDEHSGSGPDELLDQEHESLQGAARDDDPRRLDAVPLGDPLAKRAVAPARAVRENGRAVALD